MSNSLSLRNVYEECQLALRDRANLLEERIDFLRSVGLGDDDAAVLHLKQLLDQTRSAWGDVKTLAAAAQGELEQLRFERARLLTRHPGQEATYADS